MYKREFILSQIIICDIFSELFRFLLFLLTNQGLFIYILFLSREINYKWNNFFHKQIHAYILLFVFRQIRYDFIVFIDLFKSAVTLLFIERGPRNWEMSAWVYDVVCLLCFLHLWSELSVEKTPFFRG